MEGNIRMERYDKRMPRMTASGRGEKGMTDSCNDPVDYDMGILGREVWRILLYRP